MIQNIPVGVSKITSARNLSSNYKEVIEGLEKDVDSVIGVTNQNEIKFILMSCKRYERLLKLLKEYEEKYLELLVQQGHDDYINGRTIDLDTLLKQHCKSDKTQD